MHIRLDDNKPYPKWKLISAKTLDPAKMGNADRIRVAVLDENDQPKPNVTVGEDYPQLSPKERPIKQVTESSSKDKYGETEFDIGDSKIIPPNTWGNKVIWVGEDRSKSDELEGLGLINNEHTCYRLVFKWFDKDPAPPAPKPPAKK